MSEQQPAPRAHWLLLAAVGVLVFVLLFVDAFVAGSRGEGPHEPSVTGSVAVPPAVRAGGPVIDASTGDPGASVPEKTVVLTFDDGPSSYTPLVLDVLEKYHVPATFFVIGENVAGRADMLRRMVADGDEIGVHTFTHPDLGGVPAWRERLELEATQLSIASATGYLTHLLRLPYSSTTRAIDADQWVALRRAGHYRVVFADVDTRDWSRPGVGAIVRAATPAAGRGAVVMLHDGGGNRGETVAALTRLIPALLSSGYRFETVSHAIGVPSAWVPATPWQRLRGALELATVLAARWFVTALTILFFVAGFLAVSRVLILLLFARRHSRTVGRRVRPTTLPAVSVIVPAFNEEAGIAACVRSIFESDYPHFEVIVVDDGSTDGTASIVSAIASPALRLVRQPNAGKPAALNAGIAAAQHDVLVMVDGDTVFQRDTIGHIVGPLADATVGAVSGNAKVGNRRGFIGRWQHVEYVIGFNLDRRMFDTLQCMPTVPGAVGAFRRAALEDVGGVSDDTLAEDTDLTMAIVRTGRRVVYAPDAIAWTEAPVSLGALWRQRYRWCYGTIQAMWKHRGAVFGRGAQGRLGRRGLPYLLVFQVALPLLAPVVDVATVAGLFTGRGTELALTWLAFLAVQYAGALYAFVLDGERSRTLWVLPFQQVVYRQLMYLVVIQSLASAFYGARLRWHRIERTGRLDDAPSALV